jgi:hypothetical protein
LFQPKSQSSGLQLYVELRPDVSSKRCDSSSSDRQQKRLNNKFRRTPSLQAHFPTNLRQEKFINVSQYGKDSNLTCAQWLCPGTSLARHFFLCSEVTAINFGPFWACQTFKNFQWKFQSHPLLDFDHQQCWLPQMIWTTTRSPCGKLSVLSSWRAVVT